MEHFKNFIILLLAGTIIAAPTSNESGDNEIIELTKQMLSPKYIMYRSKYNIVNILVPSNALNFDENEEEMENIVKNIILFFVEGDVDAAGNRVDKGLYVYKNGVATKLLENGRDAAANNKDESKDVFFGAADGIYIYDDTHNKAEKYGSINDDIIAIAKENGTDVIYYLNQYNDLYKVTENGNKKVKINDVVGAQEIVLDGFNNLFFFNEDKQAYVLTENGVKEISGLPKHPNYVKLIRPPFIMDDGVIFLSDKSFYTLYPNGTSQLSEFRIDTDARPTAYGMDATIIQYYGYNKKIYKYNLLSLMFADGFAELKKFLEENDPEIQSVSPGKRSKKH